MHLSNMDITAVLPVAVATPGDALHDTSQSGTDIVNEVEADVPVVTDKEASKDDDGATEDAVRLLFGRHVDMRNETAELWSAEQTHRCGWSWLS